jgi:hypothetical protein
MKQGPAFAPTFLMTWLAMLEGADVAADADRGEGEPKRASPK